MGNGDGTEGAHAGRVLGTYLHGPALVRNPGLADLLRALQRKVVRRNRDQQEVAGKDRVQ